MKILITGGSGFLGCHLVRRLLQTTSHDLRVLTRGGRPPFLEALGPRGAAWGGEPTNTSGRLELCEGDILDAEAVRRAADGCEEVYHLAGLVSRSAKDASAMMRLHVDGTRLLLQEAARAKARRIVVVSTSGTVGVSKDPQFVANDASPYPLEQIQGWPYYLSKVYQEELCRDMARREGMNVVLVRPSLLLGPGDLRGSSTGDVRLFLERGLPVIPSGGISFVDVRDAAAGVVAAMDKGRAGESYLMTSANWTLREFFDRLASLGGMKAPALSVSAKWTGWGAKALRLAQDTLGLESASLPPQSLEMGGCFWSVDSTKAREELGFAPRPAERTLLDTLAWLRESPAAS